MANPAVQRARFLAPGDKLGKHDLIRQIAVGGMAEIYLARTMGIEGFEKLVVIKRILPQYANNASFVNMFLNEARLAATLHHPNIAQVYDIGQDNGEYFFSMEYVHGEDLGSMLHNANESGVPISLDAALTLGAGLCAGLHHAHEKTGPDGRPLHVVHRDVSPSNVLVSYDGAVKLVDFGIARVNSTPGSTAGGLKGKISYMSPEQCRGKTTIDRRSDIFSVGTLLYEMTTGQLPFTDETEYAILNHIVNTDAVPPSQLVAGYPPALETIVMRALARDPDKRYATTLDLQTDLEDFAHDNRLRVSPLVLARLMSTLFPARLEEWANAKAQGAFFVEQHVVRTLIESAQDSVPVLGEIDNSAELPPVTGEVVPGDDDATAVTTPPVVIEQDEPAPAPPPPRPSQPRASAPAIRTQVGVTPAIATEPPARPTPRPSTPFPTPIPNAVPIVTLQPSQPGTLISNPSVAPTAIAHDLTLRVRVPDRTQRSKTPIIVLALVGALAAAGVTFLVLGRGDDKLATDDLVPPPPPSPPADDRSAPAAAAAVPVVTPTAKPDEPTAASSPADDIELEPADKPVDKPAEQPATPATPPAPIVASPPKPAVKRPAKVVTRPSKPIKPAIKKPPPPAPKPKETPWKNGDSPFMPVRPADKK